MIRTYLVSAALMLGVTAAVAQADVIAQRKTIMKSVGAATRTGTQMARGEAPFDLARAKEILAVYEDAAKRMPPLFPENSKAGGETSAAPKIWEDMAGFRAAFAKMEAESKQAVAATKDHESFKTAFGDVTKNCGGCHQTYRITKN
jgi:cytochrome c556